MGWSPEDSLRRDISPWPLVMSGGTRRNVIFCNRRMRQIAGRVVLPAASILGASGCSILRVNAPEPTVSLRVKGNVPDAQVTVDDQLIGPLGYVAARGVAMPRGKHRITVEKTGYFPWDAVVEAKDAPVLLQIDLVPIPD